MLFKNETFWWSSETNKRYSFAWALTLYSRGVLLNYNDGPRETYLSLFYQL